jgi:hypothetical protein
LVQNEKISGEKVDSCSSNAVFPFHQVNLYLGFSSMNGVNSGEGHVRADDSEPIDIDIEAAEGNMGAVEYLSRAARISNPFPSSPESAAGTGRMRDGSLSPIRGIRKKDKSDASAQTSDDEYANLVVIENPDGTLVEGMPSGFKHVTPIVSVPQTPRTLNFAATGIDLIDLFHRHEKIFAILLILTVFLDAIILSEEFTLVFSGINSMHKSSSGAIDWGSRISSFLPASQTVGVMIPPTAGLEASGQIHATHNTFSVFPPHWQFVWAFSVIWVDLAACLIFFSFGFVAYVSKQRKSYALFSTISCGALVWQVILSCADKLSLILFLFRLATFTHARFMGDLMDDIALLSSLIGMRNPILEGASHEPEPDSTERQSLIAH